jgi:hypothetical protein
MRGAKRKECEEFTERDREHDAGFADLQLWCLNLSNDMRNADGTMKEAIRACIHLLRHYKEHIDLLTAHVRAFEDQYQCKVKDLSQRWRVQ